jgi:hypothetical protein
MEILYSTYELFRSCIVSGVHKEKSGLSGGDSQENYPFVVAVTDLLNEKSVLYSIWHLKKTNINNTSRNAMADSVNILVFSGHYWTQ